MIPVYGAGLFDKIINALPFEVHIPDYQFCRSGTRLAKRLARGDRGINRLDAACREHDIAYSRSNDLADRSHCRSSSRRKSTRTYNSE